jgi:hypothetical protein
MIEELLHYLGARTKSQGARRLGHVYEVAALQARHSRCRSAWQSHIQETHQALLMASSNIDPGGVALIIGGGTVADLPISQLLTRFERLVLVDIVFTFQARRLARRWPGRVVCCYYDVTGCVDWLATQKCLPPFENLNRSSQLNEYIPDIAWVASVNCLTQLPILPLEWLRRWGVDESALDNFFHGLIQAHLHWLADWPAQVCLITEVEEQHFDRNGHVSNIVDHRPLLQDFQQKSIFVSGWTWTLHPFGELPNRCSESRTVEAWSCL